MGATDLSALSGNPPAPQQLLIIARPTAETIPEYRGRAE